MQDRAPETAAPERIGYATARLLPFWGNLMVGDVTGATCRAYVRRRHEAGVKPATARRELGVLRASLVHCREEGYLTRAPDVVLPDVPDRAPRVLSRSEIAALVRAARSEPKCRWHLPLFILIAAYTGKRSTAIRTLQWQPNTDGDGWVDLDGGTIHWGVSGTKKRRGDPTPIPMPLATILRYAAHRGGKYVMTTPWSRGRASGPFKTAWRSALRRAGIDHARMHDTRHTAASVLLSRGQPSWLVARYLGMTEETLMRVYGHLIPGALDGVAQAVGGKR